VEEKDRARRRRAERDLFLGSGARRIGGVTLIVGGNSTGISGDSGLPRGDGTNGVCSAGGGFEDTVDEVSRAEGADAALVLLLDEEVFRWT